MSARVLIRYVTLPRRAVVRMVQGPPGPPGPPGDGSGGGGVSTFNTRAGDVVPDPSDYAPYYVSPATLATGLGAVYNGAVAVSQPRDLVNLTPIAALVTQPYGRNFLTCVDAPAARAALGLGTASIQDATAFDAAGAAAAAYASAVADSQPRNAANLTPIAALASQPYGRGLLEVANEAAGRAYIGVSFPIAGANVTPNFGAQGIISTTTLSLGAIPAAIGTVRLPKTSSVYVRNDNNTTQFALARYLLDELTLGDVLARTSIVGLQTLSLYAFSGTSLQYSQFGFPAEGMFVGQNVGIGSGVAFGAGAAGCLGIKDGVGPAGPVANVVQLWTTANALRGMGGSGTSVTVVPADLEGFGGHCPVCGTDFAVEWTNETRYGLLTMCMNCLATELLSDGKERSWIVRRLPAVQAATAARGELVADGAAVPAAVTADEPMERPGLADDLVKLDALAAAQKEEESAALALAETGHDEKTMGRA